MSGRKALIKPTEEQALPGRAEPLEIENRHFVLGRALKPPFPAGLKSAQFGMGCFWGAERVFWNAPGVYTHGAHGTRRGRARRLRPDPDDV